MSGGDLDLRKLRSFAAVAEHLHFGRAAEALHMTQPALTRQVQALERELGYSLLRRSSRSVELTPAGAQLFEEAPVLLGSAAAVVRRVVEAGGGTTRLVLGHAPGIRVAGVVRAFAASHPDVEVSLLQQEWWDKESPLREGRADVSVLRTPFDPAGLRVVPVGVEPRWLCMPVGHPLADREVLSMCDLEGQPLMETPTLTASVQGKLELVAAGRVLALVPCSIVLAYARPDVVHRPVVDALPVQLCVAVREDRGGAALRALVDLAVEELHGDPREAAKGLAGVGHSPPGAAR